MKAKVHFIEDVEMNDAEIPAKPTYVPTEDPLGIAPAISTSAVVGSSLKGMAFVQLFKLERNNGKFVDWGWFQATIERRPAVPLTTISSDHRQLRLGEGRA